jgi:hypothetical protein
MGIYSFFFRSLGKKTGLLNNFVKVAFPGFFPSLQRTWNRCFVNIISFLLNTVYIFSSHRSQIETFYPDRNVLNLSSWALGKKLKENE